MTTTPNTPGVDRDGALAIARKEVEKLSTHHDFVILEDRTVERPFGWVFFYATKKYVATRNPDELVPGTAPLVVHRLDGSIAHLATSVPPARAIDIYEQRWADAQATKGPPASP